MGLFDKFKKKNYLKRTDFINSVDSNKIWAKSMTISEMKLLLEYLENELSKYEFDTDKNFIMNSRRKTLKGMIEERLQKNEGNINEFVAESLFNFWEFVADEYPGGAGGIMNDCRKLNITIKDFDAMDKAYRDKGIICVQEKVVILEMIKEIKKGLIKRLIMSLFNFKKNEKSFNGVVFTCRHFIEEGKKITYISHKGNGDYECFCSNCEQKLDLNSVMIIGLDEILTTENNKSLFNIEKGKYIYLQDENWYEKEFDTNDEYFVWLFDIENKIINENIRRNKELRSELSGIKIIR